MRFVERGGAWHLVREDGGGGEVVLATLRSEVELLAMARFCELYLSTGGNVPSRFEVRHGGRAFVVYFLGSRGEKLTLHMAGADGAVSSVETSFIL
jgi:hypothetical protein